MSEASSSTKSGSEYLSGRSQNDLCPGRGMMKGGQGDELVGWSGLGTCRGGHPSLYTTYT
jgi:hypothetical protein